MHARVTEINVQAGKLDEFTASVQSTVTELRAQPGFRALLVLRSADPSEMKAITLSVWDSLEDLKASERNLFLYQALARILKTADGFPRMTEHQVLLSEFAVD